MNGHLIQIAREQLKDSMADMKGFTNKLLIIIVSLFFVSMISFVNNSLIREASGEPTPIIFFDVPIHKEYISFIYGVLYLVYIVGLFIKIRQFGYDVNEVQEKGLGDQVFDTVTFSSFR